MRRVSNEKALIVVPIGIIFVLGSLLTYGVYREGVRQEASLNLCALQVKHGQKKEIDCRLMRVEFKAENAEAVAVMAIGAAAGASVASSLK